ncbi:MULTISPECIES: sensor histidine kinase [unclassified Enterococcus]|uniref:sensor histidine kinase n=1 Tax=unclassified Enterococcus TaxID=2608891 RepID=UPI001CE1E758|nr:MULTISPECIES: ATP-binding protein [unclassified Enterococcus]MCA5014405.1 sensor histidine kinase [Enterococcus sp. S23]MCA5017482.1 sensor histidine kinase [Enterococcus sp. S22(2020)]
MEEMLHFKVSTGLKDIIGRDLITNELVAIFELVKNSYDAKSKNVEIIINSFENFIEIRDDGKGMDYDDITDKWLFVAYSEKKDQIEETYAGSKGIGRFSCDRLGASMVLRSKKEGQDSQLSINWGDFEKNSLQKFEELNVRYLSNESVDTNVDIINLTGTTLRIEELRDEWTSDRVEKVISSLQRLINPFVDDEKIKINVKYISSNSGIAEIDRYVSNNVANVLDTKTIYMECTIKSGIIKLALIDKTKVIYSITMKNYSILNDVFFKIYYLNSIAKNNFKRLMGQRAIQYGSIFLYKNNFRIFPYGEPDFDSFGLNLRKGQGYNRFLAHRELLGWINIIDKQNHFKEVSSRDRGFVSNEYTVSLEKVYMELIQRPLESYMQLVKFGESEIDDIRDDEANAINKLLKRFKKFEILEQEKYAIPKNAQPLGKRFELLNYDDVKPEEKKEIQKNLKEVISETKKEITQVKKDKKKIEQKAQKLQERVEVTERILEKENPERQKMLFHELGKVANELNGATDYMFSLMNDDEKEKFGEALFSIRKSSDKLSSIKKQILRINFETFSKWENIEIKSYLKSYLDYAINSSVSLNLDFGHEKVTKKINIYDFGVLIDNLILNALERNPTTISIYFEEDNSGFNFVTDTGPIDINPVENVFKLGVSSKKGGSGIGMYMCHEICKDFGWEISATNLDDNLVKFTISFGDGV